MHYCLGQNARNNMVNNKNWSFTGDNYDCNGTFYPDVDGDFYGDINGTPVIVSNGGIPPANHVMDNTDCDDNNNNAYPNNLEICDGIDNNCDGMIDEGFPDSDNDNILDCLDNCPSVANASQINSDGDAFGEACDCDDSDPNDDYIILDDDPIVMGEYFANTSINSSGTINSGDTVSLQAGYSITLGINFVAHAGTDFIAKIDSCETTQSMSLTIDNEVKNTLVKPIDIKSNFITSDNINLKISPNPFQSSAKITVEMRENQKVSLSIYDARGNVIQKIMNQEFIEAGVYDFIFDVVQDNSGVYFIVLTSEHNTLIRKIVRITQK